jgi:N-acetylmuramoyl-L-alanine amidase
VTTKNILALLLAGLCLALSVSPSSGASQRLEHTHIYGVDYVSLPSWARANQSGWGWIKRDETLYVTNGASKLLLIANSREARVNNIQVWLLFPLVNREGQLLVSQLDVDTTLRPLLFPSRNGPGVKIKTICIDPGHGGKDSGFRVGSQFEKEYTLRLARELRDQFTRDGFKVTLTRTGDSFVELPNRPQLAARRNADLFVSLHFNATEMGRNEVKGIETYALTPAGARSTAGGGGEIGGSLTGHRHNEKNMLLAYEIQKSLVKRLPAGDRGVRRARFWVLRDAAMPAVLIEGGFMSHPAEGRKIFDAAYRREMAKAIVDGVLAYKRAVERPG